MSTLSIFPPRALTIAALVFPFPDWIYQARHVLVASDQTIAIGFVHHGLQGGVVLRLRFRFFRDSPEVAVVIPDAAGHQDHKLLPRSRLYLMPDFPYNMGAIRDDSAPGLVPRRLTLQEVGDLESTYHRHYGLRG